MLNNEKVNKYSKPKPMFAILSMHFPVPFLPNQMLTSMWLKLGHVCMLVDRLHEALFWNSVKCGYYSQGCQEDWPGPGRRQKMGGCNIDCARGVGGTPPENVEILHALKCVLGASEAPFCAFTQYITCKLLPPISSFRLKSTTYGALGSRQHSCHVR